MRTTICALRISDALGGGDLIRFVRVLGVEAICGRTGDGMINLIRELD